MREFRGFPISLWDRARSELNRLSCFARNCVGWDGPALSPAPPSKHHSTIELLSAVPPELRPHHPGLRILDAGCHDFSRGPALEEFFRAQQPAITGIDIDPHWLGGRARAITRSLPNAVYVRGNFFNYNPSEPFHLITAFFPFVSPHPSLSWGLPMEWGNPNAWVASLERCLTPLGVAFTAHQGPWEEEEFAEALAGSALQTVFRSEMPSRATESPHPIRIGLHIHRPA